MKVKDFIQELKQFNPEAEMLVSCDEELNTIYSDIGTSYLTGYENQEENSKVVIWGNSGSEIE